MGFKSKTRLEKFEYKSPSDEEYVIMYVVAESDNLEYIKIYPQGEDEKNFPTWDVELILDLADHIRDQKTPRQQLNKSKKSLSGLSKPKIRDHRAGKPVVPNKEDVQQAVGSNNEVQAWSKFRTGVDVNSLEKVEETPEDLKITGDENEPMWKKDVAHRKEKEKPDIKQYGNSGRNFGRKTRVSHTDII